MPGILGKKQSNNNLEIFEYPFEWLAEAVNLFITLNLLDIYKIKQLY